MKKAIAAVLSCAILTSTTACGQEEAASLNTQSGVKLEVVTTFAGNDGNAQVYKESCILWEENTGNTVLDMSAISDDSFKMRVTTDFETGSEPDVLFFFTGADASAFIKAGKVVSMQEIRKEYPDYGTNMDGSKMQVSMVDRKVYTIPVNGYWESLFVNTTVLEAAGVSIPDADYTWEMFMKDCQQIKEAGYTPIAAALGDIPNYWWEYSIFNYTGSERHLLIPDNVDDEIGQAWVAGLNDIKKLYEAGYFPKNTNSARDEETLNMFVDGKAAFMIDGSWRINGIVQACQADPNNPETLDEEMLADYTVTYVPGTDKRKATDIIGGISMGYYITRKAWDNPAKREAAVNFVTFMTSDEVVPRFSIHSSNILKSSKPVDAGKLNSLQEKAITMLEGVTSITPALQDIFDGECRTTTFAGLPEIVSGLSDPKEAVREGLIIYRNSR